MEKKPQPEIRPRCMYPCIYKSKTLMALIEPKLLKMRANVAMETFTRLDGRTLRLNLQT